MAIMIPSPIPTKASEGEKKLYQILRDQLDDNFYVWYEPMLNSHRPDFIILGANLGLLVIEVKGWYSNQIRQADTNTFEIVSVKDDVEGVTRQTSPLRQANNYLDQLLKELPKYRILQQQQGQYQGKVAFPIGLGVIMPNITRKKAAEINVDRILPEPQVVYRDEFLNWQNLSSENLCDRLRQMFTKADFNFEPLTLDQISTIKGVINPEMVIRDEPAKTTSVRGDFCPLPDDKILITLDSKQENLARKIREVMEKYLSDVAIDVYICLDRESHASGIEGLMVEMLNNKNNQFWISQLKIRSNIADIINSALPIQRFRQLQKIPGVGKKTYEDIFKLLYSKSQSETANNLHSDKQSTM